MRLRAAGAALAACVLALAAASAGPAQASPYLRVGIYDEAQTLHGPLDRTLRLYRRLHVTVVRVNLYWGGRDGVARRRPARAADPRDPAYDWARYDRVVRRAAARGMQVVFSIFGTPAWANGGKGRNRPPRSFAALRSFAYAAARRYDGRFRPSHGRALPPVRDWLAWNEPNNPVFLRPQFRRVGGRWVIESARVYARICNAVHAGVHATLVRNERVACGVTAPRGNNDPTSSRPSVAPLAFLRAAKQAGLRRFEAWAHHPYSIRPSERPDRVPVSAASASTAVTLGNIRRLIGLVTRLYGRKRIWLTEYGYQTNPPDRFFGVSPARQAVYLRQAFAIARRTPRVDMILWFLLRDEPRLAGWQSGLLTASGKPKPAFRAFARAAAAVQRR